MDFGLDLRAALIGVTVEASVLFWLPYCSFIAVALLAAVLLTIAVKHP